jgi:hypothetical protein
MSVEARVSVEAIYHDTTVESNVTTLAVGKLVDSTEYTGKAAIYSGTVGTSAVTITPTGFSSCSRVVLSAGGRAVATGNGIFDVTLRASGDRVSVGETSGSATTATSTIVVAATAQSTYSIMVLGT